MRAIVVNDWENKHEHQSEFRILTFSEVSMHMPNVS